MWISSVDYINKLKVQCYSRERKKHKEKDDRLLKEKCWGSYFDNLSVIDIYIWKKFMEKNYGLKYTSPYLAAPSAWHLKDKSEPSSESSTSS